MCNSSAIQAGHEIVCELPRTKRQEAGRENGATEGPRKNSSSNGNASNKAWSQEEGKTLLPVIYTTRNSSDFVSSSSSSS